MSDAPDGGAEMPLTQQAAQRLSALRGENEALRQSVAKLHADLGQLQSAASHANHRLEALEQQTSHLCTLFAASQRLHESFDRRDVLLGVEEILAACLGCEHFALYELDPERQLLTLVSAVGVSPAQTLPLERGVVAEVMNSGHPFVADRPVADPEGVTACIPLRMAKVTTGVLLLHQLLPQKRRLEAEDRELLEVLATQAGSALYCSRAQAPVSAVKPRGAA